MDAPEIKMPTAPLSQKGFQRLVAACAILAGGLALLVLVALAVGHPELAAFGSSYRPQSPLAASLGLALSCSLWLLRRGPGQAAPRLVPVLAGLVAAVALAVLVAYALASGGAVERWFLSGRLPMRRLGGLAAAGLLGAACSCLAGPAFAGSCWWRRQLAAVLALLPLAIGPVVLVSYLAGVPLLVNEGGSVMALPSAFGATLLGLGFLVSAGADTWPLALFRPSPGRDPAQPRSFFHSGPLAIFLVVGAAILTLGSLYLRFQLRTAQAAAQKELEAIADLKAGQVESWYRDRQRDGEHLFRSSMLQGAFRRFLEGRGPAMDQGQLLEYLEGVCRRDGYERATLYDDKGQPRLTAYPFGKVGDPAGPIGNAHGGLALRDVQIIDLHREGGNRAIHLSVWVPVGRSAATLAPLAGLVSLRMRADQFLYPLIESWPNPSPSAETLLVRRERDQILFLSPLKGLAEAPLDLRLPFAGAGRGLPAAAALMGLRTLTAGMDYRGVRVVAAVRPVRGTPWSLVTKVDEAELYGPLWRQTWAIGSGLLLLVALLALGMGLVVRRGDSARMLGELAFERERKILAERFEHLMRQASDIILLTDRKGRILEANGAACVQYGYDLATFRTLNLIQLRHVEEAGEVMRRFDELKSRGSARFEATHVRADGSEFPVEVSGGVVDLEEEPFVLMFIRDISERRRTEQALRSSEERFFKAFTISPDAININRLSDGLYLEINEGFTRTTGYTAADVIGRSSREEDCNIWVSNSDRDRMVALLRQHGEVSNLEATFRLKDGRQIIGLMSARALEIDGEACILSITRDITERKQGERALQESERFLREAQEAGHIGTYTWDLISDEWKASDTLLAIFGVDADYERSFEGWKQLILPEFQEEKIRSIQTSLATGVTLDFEYPIQRPSDGQERWLHGKGEVERDADGRPLRLTGVIQDITERRQAEEDRRALEAQLNQVQKLDSLGSLAGGVAHDMNNVLGAILSLASAHRSRLDPADPMSGSFETITNACLRGRAVVKSLLYFARKGLEQTEDLDLNHLVREMVQLLSHTTLQRVRLELELAEPLGLVEGDSGALSHAVMNLCVNALDAMPGGGTLTLRTSTLADGRVRLAVQDTGSGMSREVREKALEPFFTTKPMGKGTGLGLAMVFGTVKAHGGTLDIQSEPGRGTEVVMAFPAHHQARATEPQPATQGAAQAGPGLAILLVDDDELIRESVAPMLTLMGHHLHTAAGGQEALALIGQGLAVDLVVLDMNMPEMNGAETLKGLLAARPDQAVLMASGYNDADMNSLISGLPRVSSIQKPFSLEEIQRKLEEMATLV